MFEKNGIIGAFLFSMGIYLSNGFVKSGYSSFPSSNGIVISLAVAVVLLFFRTPVEHCMEKKKGPFLLDAVMDWCRDHSGDLQAATSPDTLSFMRVAGLGIAHVSLMAAFSEIASLSPNTAGAILILILGNALVIALEGLSAAIQSLRLNYYEFFTKFFIGDGTVIQTYHIEHTFRRSETYRQICVRYTPVCIKGGTYCECANFQETPTSLAGRDGRSHASVHPAFRPVYLQRRREPAGEPCRSRNLIFSAALGGDGQHRSLSPSDALGAGYAISHVGAAAMACDE